MLGVSQKFLSRIRHEQPCILSVFPSYAYGHEGPPQIQRLPLSCSLNSLNGVIQGIMQGTTVGAIKGPESKQTATIVVSQG